jgi:hypothetical protein
LIGNARWAGNSWLAEPLHLWCGAIGDSGNGSPRRDPPMRDVLPELERRWPSISNQLRMRAAAEVQNAKAEL